MTARSGAAWLPAGVGLVGVSVLLSLLQLVAAPAGRAARPGQPPQSGVAGAASPASPAAAAPQVPDVVVERVVERVKEREVVVTILRVPEGIPASEIAGILERYGVVSSADEFIRLAQARGVTTRLIAGTYHFVEGETLERVLERLAPPLAL